MLRFILVIGILIGVLVTMLGLASLRSDIQLSVALMGLFAVFNLLGLALIVSRLDKLDDLLSRIQEKLKSERGL